MNPMPKRVALDVWLAAAEELLLEQRRYSISPSSAGSGQRKHLCHVATLWKVEHGQASVLQKLVLDPGRWILIIKDSRDNNHFVQFLAYEDGSLIAETVSNHYLSERDRWSREEEAELLALGWGEPNPPKRPNWFVVFPTLFPPIAEIARLAVTTLRKVLALGDWDRVVITLFSSPRRGNTPASHVKRPEARDTGTGRPILHGASRDPGPPLLYQVACEECGAWVSSELIGPDGAGEGDDGGFYCTSCRFDGDQG